MMMMAKLLLAWSRAVLTFIVVILCTPPAVDGVRTYKSRAESISLLGATEESKLYFNSCDQSSNRAECAFAIDSGYSLEPTQCSLTQPENKPWWLAILETPAYISTVTVLNMDQSFRAYQDALTNIVIMANDDVCFRYKSDDVFVKRTFPCDVIADEVIIQSEVDNSVMAICDVELLGVPVKFPTVLGDNQLLNPVICDQSSVDGKGYCENAFDGKTNRDHRQQPCAVTTADQTPWLEVTLNKPSLVNEVVIHNRGDCCAEGLNNFILTLNARTCVEYNDQTAFTSKSFGCKYFGNTLRVESKQATAMSICEMEIFGHEAAIDSAQKFKPLGCHNDKLDDLDMPQLVSSTKMSRSKCHRMCRRIEMKYFAVQNGKHCFCGSSFGKHGKVDDNACTVRCVDEDLEICGGPLLNSVFEII